VNLNFKNTTSNTWPIGGVGRKHFRHSNRSRPSRCLAAIVVFCGLHLLSAGQQNVSISAIKSHWNDSIRRTLVFRSEYGKYSPRRWMGVS
jgi:hypothetical protein